MLKNAYFLEKTVQNCLSVGGSAPRPLRCCSRLLYSKCSVFASFALLHLFFTSNSVVFVDRERKIISCPRAQGTLATPLSGSATTMFAFTIRSSSLILSL